MVSKIQTHPWPSADLGIKKGQVGHKQAGLSFGFACDIHCAKVQIEFQQLINKYA